MKTLMRLILLPLALMLPAAGFATEVKPAEVKPAGVKPAGVKPAEVKSAEPMAKVVWHVDFGDPNRLSAMIQNVNNMVTTYQNNLEDYDVRIVFLSAGVRFVTKDTLKGTPFAANADFKKRRPNLILRLQQLSELHGVKLELCEITREALNLAKGKIIPGVTPVRSGVVRIAELQQQGYAYLKVE